MPLKPTETPRRLESKPRRLGKRIRISSSPVAVVFVFVVVVVVVVVVLVAVAVVVSSPSHPAGFIPLNMG